MDPSDGIPAASTTSAVAASGLSNRFAYAWADDATASSYRPNSQYSFSATFCLDPVQGLGTDSRFTILAVGNNALTPRSAFAYANNPSASSYTPDPNFSYTSGVGPITITHDSGAGNYRVNFGTGNPTGSVFLVNSRLTPSQCHVGEWKPAAARIRCFDSFTGNPADADYQVLQVARGLPGRRIGFAFADRQSSASYTPNPSFSFNSSGGSVKVTRSATGRYAVSFTGLQKLAGHTETVQVTSNAAISRARFGIAGLRCW